MCKELLWTAVIFCRRKIQKERQRNCSAFYHDALSNESKLSDVSYHEMNESILYILAEVSVSLAGFSGVVVAFRLRGIQGWSPTELRVLWLLIGDSFLILLFSLLPIPLALANWSQDALWAFCNALLGLSFIVIDLLVFRAERRDRAKRQHITVPVISTILYTLMIAAVGMGIALLLSALNLIVPRGQAVYVLGLMFSLAFAALEFMFFIALMSQQGDNR
jgi:hypothetical protein